MTIDLDRERIACVFGLGGGELHEQDPDFPDPEGWDGVVPYWYEGAPEYATELRHVDGARTAIIDCLSGMPEPPPGWVRVASFSSSGEAECWCLPGGVSRRCSSGAGEFGNAVAEAACPVCEGDGVVYIGDGWREVVCVPA